eukprot:3506155-Rhodomonas_salina.2
MVRAVAQTAFPQHPLPAVVQISSFYKAISSDHPCACGFPVALSLTGTLFRSLRPRVSFRVPALLDPNACEPAAR